MDRRSRDTWTVFKIMGEFVEGFETLRSSWPSVSIFGGARVKRGSPYYKDAAVISENLSNAGFSIITGGGPGIMEGANRGAKKGKRESIGLNIKLPHEQAPNSYSDVLVNFRFFFARKVMFVKYATGIIGMPGGYGTLDEVFEALTLIQTQKIERMPVIFYGRSYWGGLVDWLEDRMLEEKMISRRDLKLFQVVDDPEEVTDIMVRHLERLKRKGKIDSSVDRATP
jgi:uncharacterized protein (TIGR00730 family)